VAFGHGWLFLVWVLITGSTLGWAGSLPSPLGMQNKKSASGAVSIAPIALGHALSIAIVVDCCGSRKQACLAGLYASAPAALLFGFGLYRLLALSPSRLGRHAGELP